MAGIINSFSVEYHGAYAVGGFLKASLNLTCATGVFGQLADPSGHMPRLHNGGTIDFVRIIQPVPRASTGGPAGTGASGSFLLAEYDGTGGAERWAAHTHASGATAGDAYPRFQLSMQATGSTEYTWYVEYGRVHSVPR